MTMTGKRLVLLSALALVASASAPAVAQPAPPAASTAQFYERVRRGVVSIERGGVPIAVGIVITGDNRILTALSALGDATGLDVRYADGATSRVRVVRRDPSLDVALLSPLPAPRVEGLRAGTPTPLATTPATPPAAAPGLWLGVRGESQALGAARGIRVIAVAPQSPADSAGLRADDVIAAVDGQALAGPEDLARALGKHMAGDSVRLLVHRGDDFHDITVVLREVPKT